MKVLICVILILVCFLIFVFKVDKSFVFIGKVFYKFEKYVFWLVIRLVKKVFKEVVERLVKILLIVVGIKRVWKSYKEFRCEVVYFKVIFIVDLYWVEKIILCLDG